MPTVLTINGKERTVDADPDKPLLWALREDLQHAGHEVRMRHGSVRRLHRAYQRRRDAQLHHADPPGRGQADHHARGRRR